MQKGQNKIRRMYKDEAMNTGLKDRIRVQQENNDPIKACGKVQKTMKSTH